MSNDTHISVNVDVQKKSGDPVTVATSVRIDGRFEAVLSYHYVRGIDAEYFDTDDRNDIGIYAEGLCWVRGHVSLDSDEAKALRVAFTLRYL
jgi:hypothetical protein